MSRKEKIIISATNYAREKINIDPELWVFINDGTLFKTKNHSGMYDWKNFIIRYNKDWIKQATEEQLIKTSFHEVFHVLQHQELYRSTLGIKSKLFTEKEIEILRIEFKNSVYNDSISNWHKHFAEQSAEAFSIFFYNKFIQTSISIDKLIRMYYKRFENQE